MWYMKPVTVRVDVPQGREEVYDFLDVMANHRSFNDHFLVDWELSGSERGVGSRARVRTRAVPADVIDFEVVAARAPAMIAEENVGAGGRRRATGTYTLEELPGGGTRVTFEYAWQSAPLVERLCAPLVRAFMRRTTGLALRRLAGVLAAREPAGVGAGGR